MTTFKTNRPPITGYIFKDWFITVGIFALSAIYGLLFPGKPITIKDSYFWIVGGVMLASLVDKINKERLCEINFDRDQRQIIFLYKSLFSDPKQKNLSFDNARLIINAGKSIWRLHLAGLTLYFMNGKKEVFMISEYKDGFSVDTLKDILKTVENISLPVSKI